MSRSSKDDRHQPSSEALSRYRVVSEVRVRVSRGEKNADAIEAVAAFEHPDFSGTMRKVSVRTIYRWCSDFERHGFPGLQPTSRTRIERSLVLPERLLDYLVEQKERDPRASIPELIRRARQQGIISFDAPIERTTVYRTLKRMGVYVGRRKKRHPYRDTRRFAYAHRMEMMLCDGKHFRAGRARARRVALFFLDDCTRYGLHVVVGTSESTELFLRGLYETIRRHGFAGIYYLDQGPGFISADTFDVVRKLENAPLIHGEAKYPEGRGKIERFNRTAKSDVLRGLDGRPDVDPDPGALELRLCHYVSEVYNRRPHESLDSATPAERFFADTKPLRFPETDAQLRDRFVVHFTRRVSADHVVSIDGTDYEIPRGHAGETIVVNKRLLDAQYTVEHQGKIVEIHPVDVVANARARRGRGRTEPGATQHPLPKSAADMVFDNDLAPIVGRDGGFTDNK